jgi:hypothetical protein
MKPAQLLALNATQRAVRDLFIGRAVFDDMDRKSAIEIAENAEAGHGLASGPETKLLETIPGQIGPTNSDGVLKESHGAIPSAPVLHRVRMLVRKIIPMPQSLFPIADGRTINVLWNCGLLNFPSAAAF